MPRFTFGGNEATVGWGVPRQTVGSAAAIFGRERSATGLRRSSKPSFQHGAGSLLPAGVGQELRRVLGGVCLGALPRGVLVDLRTRNPLGARDIG